MPKTFSLAADRADHPAHTPESELVLIEHHGEGIRFLLDDGTSLDFDASELRAAVRP